MDIEALKSLKSTVDCTMNDNTPGVYGPSPSEVGRWLQELLEILTTGPQMVIVKPPRKCLHCDGEKQMYDGSVCPCCHGSGSPDIEPTLPI